MENNEKKINAVELNDENLENVSGGAGGLGMANLPTICSVCGKKTWSYEEKADGKYYCPDCK